MPSAAFMNNRISIILYGDPPRNDTSQFTQHLYDATKVLPDELCVPDAERVTG